MSFESTPSSAPGPSGGPDVAVRADDAPMAYFDAPGSESSEAPDAPVEPEVDPRREAVTAMVDRNLDAAVGFCLRSFDRVGIDLDNSRAEAREVACEALRAAAAHGVAHDDDAVHRVMRRTSELALDRLAGRSGSVPLPRSLDLSPLLTGGVTLEQVAPGGRIPLAEVQDALAASRSSDRQVGYAVLAAGLPPHDAGVLLGRSSSEMDASLRRVGRRVSEAHGVIAESSATTSRSGSGADADEMVGDDR